MLRDFAEQRVEEGRLAAGGASRDQDRRVTEHGLSKEVDVARSIGALVPGLRDVGLYLALIGDQRDVEQPVAADRQGKVPPRRRRADDLDTLAGWKRRRKQRTFAVDALMAE